MVSHKKRSLESLVVSAKLQEDNQIRKSNSGDCIGRALTIVFIALEGPIEPLFIRTLFSVELLTKVGSDVDCSWFWCPGSPDICKKVQKKWKGSSGGVL
jgi:hypothetical protein